MWSDIFPAEALSVFQSTLLIDYLDISQSYHHLFLAPTGIPKSTIIFISYYRQLLSSLPRTSWINLLFHTWCYQTTARIWHCQNTTSSMRQKVVMNHEWCINMPFSDVYSAIICTTSWSSTVAWKYSQNLHSLRKLYLFGALTLPARTNIIWAISGLYRLEMKISLATNFFMEIFTLLVTQQTTLPSLKDVTGRRSKYLTITFLQKCLNPIQHIVKIRTIRTS